MMVRSDLRIVGGVVWKEGDEGGFVAVMKKKKRRVSVMISESEIVLKENEGMEMKAIPIAIKMFCSIVSLCTN